MIIKNAFKDKQTLKCHDFETTISNIRSSFKKIGVNVQINSMRKNRKVSSYSCKSNIPELNFSSSGKGTTMNQAIASALAELVERFSANLHNKYLYPDYNHIKNKLLLQFNNGEHLPGYQFSHQDDLKSKVQIEELFKNKNINFTNKQICILKNMDIAKHWVDGYSLMTERPIKVPLRLIRHLNGSNGLAAGNRLEEAIVQASCEVFERYSLIEIMSKELISPTFRLTTIDDKIIQKTIRNYKRNNIKILIKDFSLNNLFPVIAVVFINNNIKEVNSYNYQFEHIRVNAGSSFNLREAIIRCFTEKISGLNLSTFKKGFTSIYEDSLVKKLNEKIKINKSYYGLFRKMHYNGDKTFLYKGQVIPFPENCEDYNFLTDIDKIKEICKKLKSDFIVVNHTHPVLQFPTVRVIIPGYSSTLNYIDVEFNELVNYLKYGTKNLDFKNMYSDNNWLNNQHYHKILVNSILSNYIRLSESKIATFGNELNSNKEGLLVLASIYFNAKDYEKFSVVAKMISKIHRGKLGKKYLYLHYLTNHFLKSGNEEMLSIINDSYEKLKGCEKFFHTKPMKNPFISWCDKECENDCKRKYLTALNNVVESFFHK